MKQFKDVFAFEFMSLLKKRTVKMVTIVLCVIVLIGTSIPTIAKMFQSDSSSGEENVFVVREIGVLKGSFDELAELVFTGHNIHSYNSRSDLEEDVMLGNIELGFILNSSVDFELIVKDQSLDNYDFQIVSSILHDIKTNQNLIEAGMDPVEVALARRAEITGEITVLGKDSMEGYFIGIAIIFIVYMMIILYGQTVATSVAREKDSRTMELLITSTKPKTLILGKVLANSLFGLLQISLLIICAVVGFMINKGNYPEIIMVFLQGSMNLETAIIYILFSSMGYCMYLFLYGAFGSLVSRVEDVGNAVSPIMFIFVVAYMIATFSMSMPNSTLSIVSSYIPFTAIFIMPIRYMLTTVNVMEIFVSLGLMVLVTYLMIVVSVYIYRRGSLNYGNKIKMSSLIKGLLKKEDN